MTEKKTEKGALFSRGLGNYLEQCQGALKSVSVSIMRCCTRFIPVVVGFFGGWLKVVLEQIRSWGYHWRQKRVAALLLNRISWTRHWKVWSSDARDDLQCKICTKYCAISPWGWGMQQESILHAVRAELALGSNRMLRDSDRLLKNLGLRFQEAPCPSLHTSGRHFRETNWNSRNPRGSSPDHPRCLSRGFSGLLWARLLLLPRMLVLATPGSA